MSRYNTIIKNDVVNGEGICVSFFVQGCPHRCPGCFNMETWDFHNGQAYTEQVKEDIIDAIRANGILRNFSILGGEPLAPQNLSMTKEIVCAVRAAYPKIKIFLWTGYSFEELAAFNKDLFKILDCVDVIIDGQFVEEEKDLDLRLRGSKNQRIWIKEKGVWKIEND